MSNVLLFQALCPMGFYGDDYKHYLSCLINFSQNGSFVEYLNNRDVKTQFLCQFHVGSTQFQHSFTQVLYIENLRENYNGVREQTKKLILQNLSGEIKSCKILSVSDPFWTAFIIGLKCHFVVNFFRYFTLVSNPLSPNPTKW